jgi:hypothetical protein
MMVSKLYVVTVLLLLALMTACSTTDLSYRDGYVTLQLNQNRLQIPAKKLSSKIDNFSTLIVTHQLLQLDDGSMAVFDKARTDDRYEFYYPTPETIRIVFDARAVRQVYYDHSFYAFQLILSDGSWLNVIVEQLEDQSLNMLYGMDNQALSRLLQRLHDRAGGGLHEPVRTIQGKQGAILSNWTIYKVNVMQLVGPRRDLMGF